MVDSVATIMTPNNAVWNNHAVTVDNTVTEEDARLRLMDEFARNILGSGFMRVTQNDAWNIWQVAERNGYRIQVIPVAVPTKDDDRKPASVA